MDVDYSPYEGKDVKGRVETVLLRGNVIVNGDEYVGQIGDGQYLPRGRVTVHH
jgi:dihydropyrimidinase